MRTRKAILCLLPVAFLVFQDCNKPGACFTNTGTIIKEERQVGDFDSINVADYVNIILTQDSVNTVVVEAGQNVISNITTEVVSHELLIRNLLTCNWLRSYSKPINAYIHVKNLQKIYYNASGDISGTNTLKSGMLKIDIWGGCGSINLDLDVNQGLFFLRMGTVDITLHGNCNVSSMFQEDFGIFKCRNMTTGFSFITNNGSNDCYINVSQYLVATIGSIGNIYYTGNPDSIRTLITGSGKLIHD